MQQPLFQNIREKIRHKWNQMTDHGDKSSRDQVEAGQADLKKPRYEIEEYRSPAEPITPRDPTIEPH